MRDAKRHLADQRVQRAGGGSPAEPALGIDHALLYDLIYSYKDYQAEARRVLELIGEHGRAASQTLLDLACGTGQHLQWFRGSLQAAGLDLDQALLSRARDKNPGLAFYEGDMASFDLGRRFGSVTCLFGSIGYVGTLDRLRSTCQAVARHLEPGGVFVLEPWLKPEVFHPGKPSAVFVDRPEVKVARMVVPARDGDTSVLDFFFQVARADGIQQFSERHTLTLFADQDYEQALGAAGLELRRDRVGLTGRGLYIGFRP
jgi:SAM-dependent methyltransferase